MAVMHSPNKAKTVLVEQLQNHYPSISFVPGGSFIWSPAENIVTYDLTDKKPGAFAYSLLHELGHALLEHNNFTSDISLVIIERDAWDMAEKIAVDYDVRIPSEHIESCIDTYRDWLHARSLCPNCQQCGLQTSKTSYSCVFCRHHWAVSESRLCRVTRRSIKKNS